MYAKKMRVNYVAEGAGTPPAYADSWVAGRAGPEARPKLADYIAPSTRRERRSWCWEGCPDKMPPTVEFVFIFF